MSRGRRSDKTDIARDDVIMWGKVAIGSVIVFVEVDVRSLDMLAPSS